MSEYDDFYDEDEELTGEDLAAMLQGQWGPEAQAAAAELVGYEPATEPGEDAPSDPASQFTAQALRVERDIGRPLSAAEIDRLAIDQAGSGEPNVSEAYGRVINRDVNDDDDRKAILSEYVQETNEAQDAGEAEAA